MLRAALLLALAGCSTSSREPAQLPPPQSTLSLSLTGTPSPGQLFGFTVDGAQPGELIFVIVTDGAMGTDIGDCPPFLGGNCMDIAPGSLGYRVVAQGAADPNGSLEQLGPFQPGVPDGTYRVQAVTGGPNANESDVAELVIDTSCVPDPYEPNDDSASAFPVNGPIADGQLCDLSDDDWFQYTVGPDGFIEITVDYPTNEGDLDVQLYDDNGFLLDQSGRATGQEILTWYNFDTVQADVFMRVFAFLDSGPDGIPYEVDAELIQPNFCPDDAAEDDDSLADAQVPSLPATVDGVACANDADWFEIPVVAGESVIVTASSTGGDVDLLLYDDGQNDLLGGAVDEVLYTSPVAQTVYVVTELTNDSDAQPGASYTLEMDVRVLQFCQDDSHEPDDTPAEATVAVPGTYTGLSACEGSDPDWYSVDLSRNDVLDLTVDFDHDDVDIDVYLFDDRGRLVDSATGVTDQEVLAFTASRSGTHTFFVTAYADEGDAIVGGGDYTLTVAVTP